MRDFAHISRVHPNPLNIRKKLRNLPELAASIREVGILEPLVVTPHPTRPGHFVVDAGHRRLAAAKLAGLEELPIEVRAAAGPLKALEHMLVENLQRDDLTPMEKAMAMGTLRRHHYTVAQIAKAIGLAPSTVSYYLSLLDLDTSTRERVIAGQLPAGDAVAAVRSVRAATRRRNGQAPRKVSVAAAHFSSAHPLARDARARCRKEAHTARKVTGGIACGECWEVVIRADALAPAAMAS